MSRDNRAPKAYSFLQSKIGTPVTVNEISSATGWSESTVKTYLGKKWADFVRKEGAIFYVTAKIQSFALDEFVRHMSQKAEVSADPKRPVLQPQVEALVRKARESALLALQIYNNPTTVFRTEGYTVMMVIAWTSLFHAIFEGKNRGYFYLEADGVTTKLVDGDKKAWELSRCISEYWTSENNTIRRNLDFFIKLRNRVEHRFAPQIDPHVAGECQSLLLNFDEVLSSHFGQYFALRDSLAMAMQTQNLRGSHQLDAIKAIQSKNFLELKQFIDAYRSDLPSDVYSSQQFSFRVFLVPKTGNHVSSSDLSVEFVKYDPTHPEEMAQLQNQIALIKEKRVQVANANLLSATEVVARVVSATGKKFTMHSHTQSWKRHNVRPQSFEIDKCKINYCVPDERHGDYGYTEEWVNLLIDEILQLTT